MVANDWWQANRWRDTNHVMRDLTYSTSRQWWMTANPSYFTTPTVAKWTCSFYDNVCANPTLVWPKHGDGLSSHVIIRLQAISSPGFEVYCQLTSSTFGSFHSHLRLLICSSGHWLDVLSKLLNPTVSHTFSRFHKTYLKYGFKLNTFDLVRRSVRWLCHLLIDLYNEYRWTLETSASLNIQWILSVKTASSIHKECNQGR